MMIWLHFLSTLALSLRAAARGAGRDRRDSCHECRGVAGEADEDVAAFWRPRLLMLEGSQAGVFHPNEPDMVESVLAFDQRPVADIMTARSKVTFLRRDDAHDALWHKIVVSGHSSYPVHDGSRAHIVGVVSVKAIYANLAAGVPVNVGDLMEPPLFAPATQTVAGLLEAFKRTGRHLAIVVDSHNRFQGLVTLVDLLEAIVGIIPSLEERLKPEARRRKDGSWLVDGGYGELRHLLNRAPEAATPAPPRQTVADWAHARLGREVREGTAIRSDGWQFEILDMDGDRIDKRLVTPGGGLR